MKKRSAVVALMTLVAACGDVATNDTSSPGDEGAGVPGLDGSAPPRDSQDAAPERSVDADSAPPVDPSGFPPDDPTAPNTGALSADLAKNISITEIASYQSLKVSLAQNGTPTPRKRWNNIWGNVAAVLPIVAGRDALVRVFVRPDAGYAPVAITARLKLQLVGPSGIETHVFFATKTVTAASVDADLASTINVSIPANALQPGASFGVVLNAHGSATPPPTGTNVARYPMDGTLADMGVSGGGDVMHVVLVPIKYNGDGSGRMPDTSPAQVALYKDQLFRKYPVANVDVSVHAPVDYNSVISHDNGMSDLLSFTTSIHNRDNTAANVYYVGLAKPADNFWDFCGRGCVAGLSWVGAPTSVWWGYSGTDWAGGTGAHELGHAHGLPHAPCGTPDPDWWPPDADHANAKLGSWGYDAVDRKLFNPGGDPNPNVNTTYRDVMSYCGPTWIGDFNFAKLWRQVKIDNGFALPAMRGVTPEAMRGVVLRADGSTLWESETIEHRPWMTNGVMRTVGVIGPDGRETPHTGYFFPYDHIAGGRLLVPSEATRTARAIRVDSRIVVVRH